MYCVVNSVPSFTVLCVCRTYRRLPIYLAFGSETPLRSSIMSYRNRQRTFDAPVHRDSISVESRYRALASIQPVSKDLHASFLNLRTKNGYCKRVRNPYAMENQGPVDFVGTSDSMTVESNADNGSSELSYRHNGSKRCDEDGRNPYSTNNNSSSINYNNHYIEDDESLNLSCISRPYKASRTELATKADYGDKPNKAATSVSRAIDTASTALLEQINKKLQSQEEHIATVTQKITQISQAIEEANKNQSELHINLKSLQHSISKVEENMSALQKQHQSNVTELVELKDFCRGTQAAADACKRQLTKLDLQIELLQKQTKANTVSAGVTAATDGINEVTGRNTDSNASSTKAAEVKPPQPAALGTIGQSLVSKSAPFGLASAHDTNDKMTHTALTTTTTSMDADPTAFPVTAANTNNNKNSISESSHGDSKPGSVSFSPDNNINMSFTSTGSAPFSLGAITNKHSNNSVDTLKVSTNANTNSLNFTSCASAPVSSLIPAQPTSSSATMTLTEHSGPLVSGLAGAAQPTSSDAVSKTTAITTTALGTGGSLTAFAPTTSAPHVPSSQISNPFNSFAQSGKAAPPNTAAVAAPFPSIQTAAAAATNTPISANAETSDKTMNSIGPTLSGIATGVLGLGNSAGNNTNEAKLFTNNASAISFPNNSISSSSNANKDSTNTTTSNGNLFQALPFGFATDSSNTAPSATPVGASGASFFTATQATTPQNGTVNFRAPAANPFQPTAPASASPFTATAFSNNTSSNGLSNGVYSTSNAIGLSSTANDNNNNNNNNNNPFGFRANINPTTATPSPFPAFNGSSLKAADTNVTTAPATNALSNTTPFAPAAFSAGINAFNPTNLGSMTGTNTNSISSGNMYSMNTNAANLPNKSNSSNNVVTSNSNIAAVNQGYNMSATPFGPPSSTSNPFAQASASALGQSSGGGAFGFGVGAGNVNNGNGAVMFTAPAASTAPNSNILGVHQRKKTTRRY